MCPAFPPVRAPPALCVTSTHHSQTLEKPMRALFLFMFVCVFLPLALFVIVLVVSAIAGVFL